MSNMFQGKLVRLRAGEPSEGVLFRDQDREHPDNGRYLYEIGFPEPRFEPPPVPTDSAKPHDDNFPFTIETLDSVVVGAIHMHHCNLRCGTFMYGIGIFAEHRRKGYAREAIWLALRYYFYERRYQKCTAEVYSFNEASARLHERLGFTLEGRLRRMMYTDGAFHDSLFFGITHEEFRARDITLQDGNR
ncbi:MAG: GNAT family N-acetyltransferase [Anaerolineae bacterium]|nr:GNAT family N-acetyltransferase [Anaerolineae bacterium]